MTVEPAASGDEAEIIDKSKIKSLPYASDIANAASNTNTGVPGKYVVDMNGKYADYWGQFVSMYVFHSLKENPPPPPCNCKRRITAMACHVIKERSGEVPGPCQEFNWYKLKPHIVYTV